jgi:hypothetical protein
MARRMTRLRAQESGIQDIEKETVAVARGNPLMTTDDYWKTLSATKSPWGVMEVDTDFRVVQFAATSIVWGLKNEDEAALLAALMTHVMLACDEEHAGKKVYVPYGRPACVVTVPIVPRGAAAKKKTEAQELELGVPENFPVFYHDAAWSAFLAHFRDDYAIMEPVPPGLKDDKSWLRALEHRVQTEAAQLPNAMWTHEGEMMLLQPTKAMEFVPNASSGDDSEEDNDPMDVDGEEEEEEDEDDE